MFVDPKQLFHALGFQDFFGDAANGWLPYILSLNVIGGITMAFLQTAKDLLPMRQAYQRRALRKWFEAGASRVKAAAPGKGVSANRAEEHLIALATNGDDRALFDLQIEQLCGLFNATIQVVLESPTGYVDLLRITASRANPNDVKAVLTVPSPVTQAYVEARNRVLHHCQRAIGAFQVDCDFRWKWIMQLLSLIVSTILASIALNANAVWVGNKYMSANFFSIVVTALLSGFLAPVAKDLLAIVQRARGE